MYVLFVLFIICVLIIITFILSSIFVVKTRKENFISESILTDVQDTVVTNIQSKRCFKKQLATSPNNKYDVLDSYRLLEHPTDISTCYLKMSDGLVQNNCSAFNTGLYNSKEHGEFIDTIKTSKLKDPHVSKTFDQSVCEIKFKNIEPDKIQNYLQYLDSQDPIINQVNKTKIQEQNLLETIKLQYKQSQVDTIKLRQTIIEKQKVIVDLEKTIKEKEALHKKKMQYVPIVQKHIDQRKQILSNLPNEYKKRNALKAKICMGFNVSRCVELPLGRYDVNELKKRGIHNDAIKSAVIPYGLRVTFYDHGWFNGARRTFNGSNMLRNFAKLRYDQWGAHTMFNTVSSVEVQGMRIEKL